jgi:MFS family permease
MDSAGTKAIAPLVLGRALRDFGDGFVAILLPVYLTQLGFSPLAVGVIATAALLGSALMTLAIGMLGGRLGQRRLLLAAANLMIATGVAFAMVHDYAVLLVVAFAGTANPTAGNVSIFVPLEHAVLSGRVAAKDRTAAFARYSFFGQAAGALGALSAAAPDFMAPLGLGQLGAVKAMFVLYALLGLLIALAYARIPAPAHAEAGKPAPPLGPSKRIVYKLAGLFAIDAFAGGLTVQSLLALWLFERFELSLSAASLFFFWAGVLSAFSLPVAAWLARHIGLVNTMVWTHIPSSVALIAAAFVSDLAVALGLLLVRAALSQMDVPTRSSYVMAVVSEAERPAAASVTSVPRSLASAVSPSISGAMFAAAYLALPLVLCGVLKIAYDLLLLHQFRHVKPPEER